MAARCECCDLPVASCGKAAETQQRQQALDYRRWLVAQGWFSSQYPVRCCECHEWHKPGILIKRAHFGDVKDYRAQHCAPDMPEGAQ